MMVMVIMKEITLLRARHEDGEGGWVRGYGSEVAGHDDGGRAEVARINIPLVNKLLPLRVRAVAAAASLASGARAECSIGAGCACPVGVGGGDRRHVCVGW